MPSIPNSVCRAEAETACWRARAAAAAAQHQRREPGEPIEPENKQFLSARERGTESAPYLLSVGHGSDGESQKSMELLRRADPGDTSGRNSEEVPDSWRPAHFLHDIVFSSSRRLTAERGRAAQQLQQRWRYSSRRTRRRRRKEHPSDQRGGRVSMSLRS